MSSVPGAPLTFAPSVLTPRAISPCTFVTRPSLPVHPLASRGITVPSGSRRQRVRPSWRSCDNTPSSSSSSAAKSTSSSMPLSPAHGPNARRLARMLSAHWSNKDQAYEFPTFWSYIHVVFRPLPWNLLNGYAFYTESANDYDISGPYKTSVVLIVSDGTDNHLELASYKIADSEEFWLGAHRPELLEGLKSDMLTRMSDLCNSVFIWDEPKQAYFASTRPGKLCRIRRGGEEAETYLDSKIELHADSYKAWDLGKDPETDERVWGTPAGPFEFACLERLDHLVPDEPAEVTAAVATSAAE